MPNANRVLVVGSGGREHAICRALATAPSKPTLFCAPGNGGTTDFATNVEISATNIAALVEFATRESVDLVVVGPEQPLVMGLADALAAAGILCTGPRANAAQLEGSKAFMREVAKAASVPSPTFVTARREAELAWAIDAWATLPVVKASGLASGKGVFLPDSKEECRRVVARLLAGELGEAGMEIVLEERMVGTEASLFFACDGTRAVALPHARDHKRIFDNDRGPNTGGMGAVSPNPDITPEIVQSVHDTMIMPVLAEMRRRGAPFCGFLFAGLMLTKQGPKLMEFNVRLGDPEAEAILPRLAPGSFLEICLASAQANLSDVSARVLPEATCAIVAAAENYPDKPKTGDTIKVGQGFSHAQRWIDHAGTQKKGADLVTAGGRVLAVVAKASDPTTARALAYDGIHHVTFRGMQFRKDIGVIT